MTKFESILKKAKIKLFRKDFGLNLFGNILYKFHVECVEYGPEAEGFVKLNEDYTQFDGVIYTNQYYIEKEDYNHDNLIFLMIHEMLHILDKDNLRRKNRDPYLWNLAGDHCIDRTIKEMVPNIKPYNNQYNIINELHKENPKCTKEQAYKWLYNKKDQFQKKVIKVKLNQVDGELSVTEITMPDGQTLTVTNDLEAMDGNKLDNETKAHIENFIAEARALNEVNKKKGNQNGAFQEYIDNLLKIEIPWDDLLDKSIKKHVIMRPDSRSWHQLNKFYTPHNITLPGVTYAEDHDGVGTLIICCDDSGSISKKDLERFSYVIAESFKYYQKIILIVHSYDIVGEPHIFTNKLEFLSFIKNIGFKERGGTSHKDAFDWIENNIWNNNGDKDELSLVISLTDGYSDIESIYKTYNWIKSAPSVILLTQDGAEENTMKNNLKDRDKMETIKMTY